ncbi:hypothetical protein CFC21_024366 [Triticum aestivum]|uniref:Uncharacterized protein n=2 Tax=Triticum aestivum TaxID=4565 RepID=A0A3B6C9A6_WHEAT|nr:hypothetical protein CFC21_024366 [Triticum aestivum]
MEGKIGGSIAAEQGEILKGKKASASEGSEIRKMNKASASERGEIRASQGTEVLKRKKELAETIAAEGRRWLGRRTTAEDAQPSGSGKKRKVVVKRRLPQALIDFLIANPCKLVDELPDDVLAEKDYEYRETYAEKKDKAQKINAYNQTLIDQYYANGYADDESEVSDDEEETVEN